MDKVKLFVWGDAVTKTGFSRVLHNIIGNLPKDKYDISWLGINYFGDPHEYPYRIYPCTSGQFPGDFYGKRRLYSILTAEKPDVIFLLNDVWVTSEILEGLKEIYKDEKMPKVVVYIPIDAKDHNPNWYKDFDVVSEAVVYTKFGYNVAKEAAPDVDFKIIPHGIDSDVFFKLHKTRRESKELIWGDREDFLDSFIVLSANRNQPRKRLDIAMKAFALFAEGKDDVKLHMHCGVRDSAIDVELMAKRLGISSKLSLTNRTVGPLQISENKLNLLYNATDVGLNTGLGEGFSLTQIEHAVTGAPQIVANHSALTELYYDCGILVPTISEWTLDKIMTTGDLVSPEGVAEKLELLYNNEVLRETLGKKSVEKFTREEYSWKYISKQWDELFTV
jgi:glycosyltransferase involved in cell wall biosynthesis